MCLEHRVKINLGMVSMRLRVVGLGYVIQIFPNFAQDEGNQLKPVRVICVGLENSLENKVKVVNKGFTASD